MKAAQTSALGDFIPARPFRVTITSAFMFTSKNRSRGTAPHEGALCTATPLPGLHFQGSERVGGVPRVGLVPIAVRGDLARAEGAPRPTSGRSDSS